MQHPRSLGCVDVRIRGRFRCAAVCCLPAGLLQSATADLCANSRPPARCVRWWRALAVSPPFAPVPASCAQSMGRPKERPLRATSLRVRQQDSRYRTRRHRPDHREWRRSTGRDGARSDVTHRVQRRRLQRRFLLFETLRLLELLREVLGKRRVLRIRAHFLRLLQGRPHRPWDEADATCHSLPLSTAERVQCGPSALRLCQNRPRQLNRALDS